MKKPTTGKRFKSRNLFAIEAQGLLAHNINALTRIHTTSKELWTKTTSRLYSFITNVGPIPTGHE